MLKKKESAFNTRVCRMTIFETTSLFFRYQIARMVAEWKGTDKTIS